MTYFCCSHRVRIAYRMTSSYAVQSKQNIHNVLSADVTHVNIRGITIRSDTYFLGQGVYLPWDGSVIRVMETSMWHSWFIDLAKCDYSWKLLNTIRQPWRYILKWMSRMQVHAWSSTWQLSVPLLNVPPFFCTLFLETDEWCSLKTRYKTCMLYIVGTVNCVQ